MNPPELLTEYQAGVISRKQLLADGLSENDVRRLLRRRELRTVHPGVYVDHTGEPTWVQHAWAAVLAVWPAALCDESALRAAHGSGRIGTPEFPIHVAVDRMRHVVPPAGVVLHRVTAFERVSWTTLPPRVRFEDAVLDVALKQRRKIDAVGVLAQAVGDRRTTARRLREALEARPRVAMRDWLSQVLHDIETGVWSVLEHGYLDRVERPHGLPVGRRQVRFTGTSGTGYTDVEATEFVVVELDGRLYHSDAAQRDRDLDRDLDKAVLGQVTVRLGWRQVFDAACSTAVRLGEVFKRAGWDGEVTQCSPQCPADRSAA